MIANQCFSKEWITRKRGEMGSVDPALLEKSIHAFALLCALGESSIPFVFKGGTRMILLLYEHRGRINAPVMIGVGAAFDFLVGTKPQAPRWLRNNGFEWLFRLITEPKRLWHRYLVDYPLFIYYLLLDLILKSLSRPKTGTLGQ